MSRSSPRLGRRPAGTPRACPMAPPLSGRTCALEAVREDRARTDRVSLSRGCLGCGLGRNIVVSASVGHRPTSCADCHHGCERSIALRAGHTRPTARSTLRPFSNSYSVFSLWLGEAVLFFFFLLNEKLPKVHGTPRRQDGCGFDPECDDAAVEKVHRDTGPHSREKPADAPE